MDGLPAGFGWLLLIVAPLSFLLAIKVSFGGEVRADLARARKSMSGLALLAVLLGGFALEAGWVSVRIFEGLRARGRSYEPIAAGGLPEGYTRLSQPLPEFKLVDQYGKTVTPSDLRGRVTLLTFAFAHCQTMCPTLVKNTMAALRSLDPSKTTGVFITLDPWRDTPQSLPSLAKRWDTPANVRILSGAVDDVTATLDRFNVPWQRDANTGDVQHPALVYVIDSDARIAYVFNNPGTDWLTDAAKRLSR